MKKLSFMVILAFAVFSASGSGQVGSSAAAVPVHKLVLRGRTMDVLDSLAQKYKVVIGLYGTLVGPDRTVIEISLEDGTLQDVLNQIVARDSRFDWRQDANGGIHVTTRGAPLPLADVTIASFDVNNPARMQAIALLAQVPEVRSWLERNRCRIDEMIAGYLPKNWGQFSVHIKAEPLWAVFDEMAAKSELYFWSAVRYSLQPCAINAIP